MGTGQMAVNTMGNGKMTNPMGARFTQHVQSLSLLLTIPSLFLSFFFFSLSLSPPPLPPPSGSSFLFRL
jgi:hypothetical protein